MHANQNFKKGGCFKSSKTHHNTQYFVPHTSRNNNKSNNTKSNNTKSNKINTSTAMATARKNTSVKRSRTCHGKLEVVDRQDECWVVL
jgi:hypothetical protein